MSKSRTLLIGLDGYDSALGDRLMREGLLPNIRALKERSARMELDHGAAKRTGLAWEQVATGLAPGLGGRWSAISFDTRRYSARQEETRLAPFAARMNCRTVVFDAPYFDLRRAPDVRGLVAWGAHDPGVPAMSAPAGLEQEIKSKFGSYPAPEWIYGFCWPSPEKTEAAARALCAATEFRAEITHWLLAERLPDWDLGFVVVSELHSASEPLWHGMDPDHPLHSAASAPNARAGLIAVYQSVDRLVGRLVKEFPDAVVFAFSMHGMGSNHADVAAMLLLPELMHRFAFQTPHFQRVRLAVDERGYPMLSPQENWDVIMRNEVEKPLQLPLDHLATRLADKLRGLFSRNGALALDWMPAAHYRKAWPKMPAFALPAFYDGQVRLNLVGRESRGRARLNDYGATCDAIEQTLRECVDPITRKSVVADIQRPAAADPLGADASQCDLLVIWNGCPLGFLHPSLGQIGPVPYRRTGGHTGGHGMAFVAGNEIAAGDRGLASAFDVVPTVMELLGEKTCAEMSGKSFLSRLK